MAPKLSLYANLLGSSTAPAAEPEEAQPAQPKKPQVIPAALRFQPPKRPQANAQKQKPKFVISKPAVPATAAQPAAAVASKEEPALSAQPGVKTSIADWTGNDDSLYFGEEQRQRGGRKARKKKRNKGPVAQDWDDIYDPTRPNSYEEYMQSEERIREIRDWRECLYAHRQVKRRSSDTSSDDNHARTNRTQNARFAPPASYNFAPPSFATSKSQDVDMNDSNETASRGAADTGAQYSAENVSLPVAPPPPPPPPPPQELEQVQHGQQTPDGPRVPPPPPTGIIARAPVRYNLPAAPSEIPASEAELAEALMNDDQAEDDAAEEPDAPRSIRPGQKGFAERLMAKYGWTKGSGLGAAGSGITSALKVKVDKKGKNLPGGGRGKIVGGKRKEDDIGKFGAMSEVVVLHGMVDGLDLDREMGIDGTLVQEIGEECGDKYGRVERVFIDRSSDADSVPVFIHFTSQLSALRAVNALEGRVFNGNAITARFYDVTKFQQGVYV